ncbi:MAG: PAS domain S-box protein [Thermoanaerobaculia bacterium]|nr:PAS domain S-box protein [Thermoanaerobaculia bacterium]
MDPKSSWYYRVFEATTSGIFVYSRAGNLIAINQAGCRMAGRTRDEILGMDPREFIAPESHHVFTAFSQAVGRGETFFGEATGLHKDGSRYEAEVTGTTVEIEGETCFLSSLTDVTERNLLQRQLQQSQRMEAIGNLAGGIAHDFNNLLLVILGYTELVMDGLGPDHPQQENLHHIVGSSKRAATLTSRLLAFGRKQVLSVDVHDLNALIEGFAPILERALGGLVEVAWLLSPQPCLAVVDVGQIEQVLLNLALNARDAMPGGGRLTLELGVVEVDEAQPGLKPGPHVVLSVSDDGAGIGAEDLDKLFDPFFTTRREAGGTGLGLSMVHGIVNQLGGHISVDSEVEVGTTFRIYLPEASRVPSDGTPVAPAEPMDLEGSESLVVVDDNDSLRRLVGSILRKHGYEVRTFRGSTEILALTEAELGRPVLLITDVMMPGLNGKELYLALAERLPELEVLYISGYTENAIERLGLLDPGIEFLEKPFTAENLARRVRTILNGNRTAS